MKLFSKNVLRLLLAACCLLTVSLNAAGQSRFVTTSGKQIIAPKGQPLILKGIGLGNWLLPEGYMFKFKTANSPRRIEAVLNELIGPDEARKFWQTYRLNYITQDDLRFIRQAGFNSVRVPFNYRLFVTESDPARLEGDGYACLDRLVAWCKAQGLYVILDMHAAPGGQTGDNIDDSWGFPYLFENAASQQLTIDIWRKLAERYRAEPAVLGYDLLNEPISNAFDVAAFNPRLEPLYRSIVKAIREVDRNHIIFLGGAQWDTNFKVFGPPFDSRLAYTFHKYWMDVNRSAIQEYLDFRDKYSVPIWLGESGENTDAWIASFRTLLEANDTGWCFWPYKKMDARSCVVSINPPVDWNAIITFAEGPRLTFEEVRKNRPAREKIDRALNDYLEAVKFKNCRKNPGYLEALGLNPAALNGSSQTRGSYAVSR